MPPKPTPASLAASALFYLERYAASEASLRRVLQNKIRRAALIDPVWGASAREALAPVIDAIVDTHKRTGVLNDDAFAEMKVRSMRRGGRSASRIKANLAAKGVASGKVAAALDGAAAEGQNDLAAARLFAKKKGLGPFRRPGFSPKKLDPALQARREVASMARAGFAFDVIRQVLGETEVLEPFEA